LGLYEAQNNKDESSPRIGRAIALLQARNSRAEGESVVKDLASAKLPPYEAQRLEELKRLLASGKP
jgi:hypothetical protein